MAKKHWKERFGDGGICDFKKNYDFYWKWLLNKTCSCFYIKNLPETINEYYLKSSLLIDGDIGITKFNGKLYAVVGAPSGQPDEYYVPKYYTVANPVLGSKVFERGVDGTVIYNTAIDQYIPGGLSGLIDQTATLLADNIISINCNQINSRVAATFTADSEAQAIAGEAVLKKMYTGAPYQILRSDVVEKIGVNPIATSAVSQNLTELVELNNYIIANYFQSIGIKANNIRKKAHVLQEEIDVQNDYLQVSILEILTSWQRGFDEVNAREGTDIQVELNPALIDTLIGADPEQEINSVEQTVTETNNEEVDTVEEQTEDVTETNTEEPVETVEPEESITEELQADEEKVEELIDLINDELDESDVEEVDENDEEISES